jgi:hypothetical protein
VVMATTAQGEGVARLASPAANVQRTEGAVVGASIAHPASISRAELVPWDRL